MFSLCFFFQAEDGIRDLVRSRGLGDVYKRQVEHAPPGGRHLQRMGVALLALLLEVLGPDQLDVGLSLIHI